MATRLPAACSFFTSATFRSGRTSASTRSMPRLARCGFGDLALVPGDHPDFQARLAQAAHGLGGFGLDVSAISMAPAGAPSIATVAPGLPMETSCPRHARVHTMTGQSRNSVASSSAMPRSAAASTMALPTGCSE